MHSSVGKQTGFMSLMVVQIIFLALYWWFVRYDKSALPIDKHPEGEMEAETHEEEPSKYPRKYNETTKWMHSKGFKIIAGVWLFKKGRNCKFLNKYKDN